jgi:pimeloyl-ACP methyl ester carboxylesterase
MQASLCNPFNSVNKQFFTKFLAALSIISLVAFDARADDTNSAPAANKKFTYVLVHGAWGGGWDWKHMDDLLTADGNKVYRATLTGQGERSHLASTNIDLDTHIQDVVNIILWEDLHDVVLVGHSYGGMVITGVADRVPDRIKHLIYLNALAPENGESADSIQFDRFRQPVKDGFSIPTFLSILSTRQGSRLDSVDNGG